MKIMILTAATGGGHISAANALEEYIRENSFHDVVTVDALKAIGTFLDRTICDSYHFMAKQLPALFGGLYKQTNKPNHLSALVPKINSQFSSSLNKAISLVQPDVILSTHPFATEMVSHLKKKGKVSAALITVITDYGLHRAWLAEHSDAYCIATDDMIGMMLSLGVPKSRIHSFGIPVHKAFFNPPAREQTLEELGFSEDVPTILLMAGSFGVSGIIKFYRGLARMKRKLQVIVITGRNERLYQAFSEEISKTDDEHCRTHLVLFTREVPKYMNAADLIITKPGGLTVSEALACNLPLAVFDAIPGQEEENAMFLERHNMGIRLHRDSSPAELLSRLLEDPERLAEMRDNCRSFDKSAAPRRIIELAEKLVETRSTPAEAPSRKKIRSVSLRVKRESSKR